MIINIIKKEKTVNFRSFLIIALFVLASVLCALIAFSIPWLGLFLFALSLFLCALLGFIYKKKQSRNHYKYITFIVCAVFMCIAFASFLVIENTYSDEIRGEALIYGMVESDTALEQARYIYLSKAKINGISVDGKIRLSVKDVDGKLESGTLISISAYVENVKLVNGYSVNAGAFRYNIRYYAEIEAITSSNITGKIYPGLMTKLREAIYFKLTDTMGEENGALAYGMITGDKAYISGEAKYYFTIAGLSHILAVSGLHLSVLCAFLMFILNKLRVNRKITASITFAAVIFYVFLADFSPSILRAGLMSLLIIYVYLTGSRNDILNSLSFAFCVILAFSPFFLFEAGFILSICCVYGIALFSKGATRAFLKIKLPRKVAQAFGTGLSIQMGLFPACIFVFNSFQPYSLAVNIIMIPCVTVIFIAIFISLLFSFITTLGLPLSICGYGITYIDYVAKTVASFPCAKLIVYSTQLIFLCYGFYFLMSRFVIKRSKIFISLLCIIQCVMLAILQNPTPISKESIVPLHFSYSNVSMVNVDGRNYIVGDFWNGSAIRNKLTSLKTHSIEGIFVNKLNENTARQIIIFSKTFMDFDVYFPLESTTNEALDLIKQNKLITLKCFDTDIDKNAVQVTLSNNFHAIFEDKVFCAYGLEYSNVLVAFIPFGKNYTLFQSITQYNIIRSNYYYPSPDIAAVFLVNNSDSNDLAVISSSQYDDYAFNFDNGEVYIPKTIIFS